MVFGLLCLTYFNVFAYFTIARPLEGHQNVFNTKSDRGWLWSWTWGTESTVSVIDHTPVLSFSSRPGIFTITSSLQFDNPSIVQLRLGQRLLNRFWAMLFLFHHSQNNASTTTVYKFFQRTRDAPTCVSLVRISQLNLGSHSYSVESANLSRRCARHSV